jgi:tetratricopeptide (TPR) repeat protein
MCAIRTCAATSTRRRPDKGVCATGQSPLRRALFFGARPTLLECGGMNLEAWLHYQRSRIYALFNRPDDAVSDLKAALQLDPSATRALSSLGFLQAKLGNHELAAGYFRQALAREPDNAVLHFDLGYVLHMQKNLEPAIAAFREAVSRDPKLDRAWYGMGLALDSLDRHEEAAEALKEAAALQPMNGHAWYELGMAYYALKRKDKLTEVVAHLNRFDPKMALHLSRATGAGDPDAATDRNNG